VRKTISFRLRAIDSDLEEATKDIDQRTLSEMCRNGLRLMLGIKTTKIHQTVERPIMPQKEEKERAIEKPRTEQSISMPLVIGNGGLKRK
jgi:hypothetical protein